MRQFIISISAMVGLCSVLAATARGDGPPAASDPPIVARARRMIQAGDREAALNLLEDALIDGPAGEKPAVVELLRRSYETMAREAEAAGRAEDAARYRDNLAILGRPREAPGPPPAPRPRVEPSKPPVQPPAPRPKPPELRGPTAPGPDRPKSPDRAGPSGSPRPEAIAPPSVGAEPPPASPLPEFRVPMPDPGPSEPSPLPEPAKLPMPKPSAPAPAPADDQKLPPLPGSIAATKPATASPTPDARDGREMLFNPGEATGPAASPRPVAPAMPPPTSGAGVIPPRTQPAVTATGSPDLATADQLFRAQNFEEAGRIYATLAARDLLPTDRRPHWAYCRFKAVVRRINAGPRSAREWDAIEEEVRSIQRLTPDNWYGEYLINKVGEARRSRRRRGGTSDSVVVRGSSPDEPSPPIQPKDQPSGRRRPGLLGRSRQTPEAPAQPGPSTPPGPAGDAAPSLPGSLSLPEGPTSDATPVGPRGQGLATATSSNEPGAASWQVHESTNFRIYHRDPALAERVAAVAESVRTAQGKRWGGAAARTPWSPRCELYLYPTSRSFAEATGQAEMSPGISSMSNDGVRVLSRRMSLRADNPLLLTATLPHEVTHIVLADLFIAQPIPRWVDEGLAVLAEPESERLHRRADLKGPLDAGRVFEVGPLMAMDYPDPKDWRLFYAQSVSLTQFLVDQGPPERFIRFVRDTQRVGTEAALRDVYQIEGLAALQQRWLAYAREQAAVDLASNGAASPAPEGVRRD